MPALPPPGPGQSSGPPSPPGGGTGTNPELDITPSLPLMGRVSTQWTGGVEITERQHLIPALRFAKPEQGKKLTITFVIPCPAGEVP